MVQYILLCLDCNKIFPGREIHTCERNIKTHFAAKVDGENEPVWKMNHRLDGTMIRYSESSSFEDGIYDQSLIENRFQILSTTEETVSNQILKEKTPIFEASIEQNELSCISSSSNHVQQPRGSFREGLPLFELELQNSNLSATPLFQDGSYNSCTTQNVSNFCTSYYYPTCGNLSSIYPRNMDASAGPSNGWNLLDQCEPLGLETHRRVEDIHFEFPICGRSVRKWSDFDAHYRTHTGEKPFACDICEKKFSTQHKLTVHRRTHTGEKPYSCDICENKYNTKYSLNVHHRTHTGERPYSCNKCDHKSSTKSDLERHRKTHTGFTSCKCPICGKIFSSSGYCKSHINQAHQKK